MTKRTNTVLPQFVGLLAVGATRHFTETASALDKPMFGLGHAYAPRDFALERIIVTSVESSKIHSTKDDEKRIEIKGEVLFRSLFAPNRTVRIEISATIHMNGEEVINFESTIVSTKPDLASQAAGHQPLPTAA